MKKPRSKRRSASRATPTMGRQSIGPLFPNRALLDTLALLLLHQGQEFYQRQVAELIGAEVVQVQRALRRIESVGLVAKVRRGNRVYYMTDQSHPAFRDLKNLILRTVALGDVLRAAVEPLADQVDVAFLFGSFAAGTESPASDIDLFIVGDLSSREASRILGPVGRRLGRAVNSVIYSARELREKAIDRNRFIEGVIAGPKVWLIGNEDDLTKLVK